MEQVLVSRFPQDLHIPYQGPDILIRGPMVIVPEPIGYLSFDNDAVLVVRVEAFL